MQVHKSLYVLFVAIDRARLSVVLALASLWIHERSAAARAGLPLWRNGTGAQRLSASIGVASIIQTPLLSTKRSPVPFTRMVWRHLSDHPKLGDRWDAAATNLEQQCSGSVDNARKRCMPFALGTCLAARHGHLKPGFSESSELMEDPDIANQGIKQFCIIMRPFSSKSQRYKVLNKKCAQSRIRKQKSNLYVVAKI